MPSRQRGFSIDETSFSTEPIGVDEQVGGFEEQIKEQKAKRAVVAKDDLHLLEEKVEFDFPK